MQSYLFCYCTRHHNFNVYLTCGLFKAVILSWASFLHSPQGLTQWRAEVPTSWECNPEPWGRLLGSLSNAVENELFPNDISETHWIWSHLSFEQKGTWWVKINPELGRSHGRVYTVGKRCQYSGESCTQRASHSKLQVGEDGDVPPLLRTSAFPSAGSLRRRDIRHMSGLLVGMTRKL